MAKHGYTTETVRALVLARDGSVVHNVTRTEYLSTHAPARKAFITRAMHRLERLWPDASEYSVEIVDVPVLAPAPAPVSTPAWHTDYRAKRDAFTAKHGCGPASWQP